MSDRVEGGGGEGGGGCVLIYLPIIKKVGAGLMTVHSSETLGLFFRDAQLF